VFVLCGLVPWTFFTNSVTAASESVTRDSNLVSKVYFPRAVTPLGAIASWLPDLAIATALLCVFLVGYRIPLGVRALLLVPLILLLLFVVVGVGIWLSALNVAYRDVRFAVPFGLQLWFFATPVIYPVDLIPAGSRWLLGFNPLAAVVEGFRWCLAGGPRPSLGLLAASLAATGLLLSSGLMYFRRVEQFFADII